MSQPGLIYSNESAVVLWGQEQQQFRPESGVNRHWLSTLSPQDGGGGHENHPHSWSGSQGLHPSAGAVVAHQALLPQTNHSVCLNPAAGGTGTPYPRSYTTSSSPPCPKLLQVRSEQTQPLAHGSTLLKSRSEMIAFFLVSLLKLQ